MTVHLNAFHQPIDNSLPDFISRQYPDIEQIMGPVSIIEKLNIANAR
ncbi:hypothetical protein ACERCG_04850 [Mannheimia sp. E30BD]